MMGVDEVVTMVRDIQNIDSSTVKDCAFCPLPFIGAEFTCIKGFQGLYHRVIILGAASDLIHKDGFFTF